MNSVEDMLDQIDEIIETARPVPMMGGRAMINTEALRTLVEDIRLALPQEIRKARSVVEKRNELLADARKEAEAIVRKAEDRARQMVNQEEIVRQANQYAAEREEKARANAKEIRRVARDYAETCLRRTEDYMSQRLGDLRKARQGLHNTMKSDSTAGSSVEDSVVDDD